MNYDITPAGATAFRMKIKPNINIPQEYINKLLEIGKTLDAEIEKETGKNSFQENVKTYVSRRPDLQGMQTMYPSIVRSILTNTTACLLAGHKTIEQLVEDSGLEEAEKYLVLDIFTNTINEIVQFGVPLVPNVECHLITYRRQKDSSELPKLEMHLTAAGMKKIMHCYGWDLESYELVGKGESQDKTSQEIHTELMEKFRHIARYQHRNLTPEKLSELENMLNFVNVKSTKTLLTHLYTKYKVLKERYALSSTKRSDGQVLMEKSRMLANLLTTHKEQLIANIASLDIQAKLKELYALLKPKMGTIIRLPESYNTACDIEDIISRSKTFIEDCRKIITDCDKISTEKDIYESLLRESRKNNAVDITAAQDSEALSNLQQHIEKNISFCKVNYTITESGISRHMTHHIHAETLYHSFRAAFDKNKKSNTVSIKWEHSNSTNLTVLRSLYGVFVATYRFSQYDKDNAMDVTNTFLPSTVEIQPEL